MTGKILKERKRIYVSGLAQLDFEPQYSWTSEEACNLYTKKEHQLPVDTILYEDSIKGMAKIPDSSVDLVIADPPFGIAFSGKSSQYNRKSELVTSGYNEINTDYKGFTDEWIGSLPRIMKPTSSAYIVSGWTNLSQVLNAIDKSGLKVVNHLIWKYQFGVFTKRKFVSSHYHILFTVRDEKKYFFNKYEFYPEDVWEIPRNYKPGQEKNGTKLPEKLVERFINFSSSPGDLIFDPFMGNATTAVCAKSLFRRYYGFEINEGLKKIHEINISSVEEGEGYVNLKNLKPSIKETIKKYPHLKKHITYKKEDEDLYDLGKFSERKTI